MFLLVEAVLQSKTRLAFSSSDPTQMEQGRQTPQPRTEPVKVVGFHVEGASPSPKPSTLREAGHPSSLSPVIIPPAFQVGIYKYVLSVNIRTDKFCSVATRRKQRIFITERALTDD